MIPRIAARGAVDFAGADLLDPNFWTRLRLIGRAILDEEEVRLRALEFQRELAYLQAAAAARSEDVRKFADRAETALSAAWSLTFPWVRVPDRTDAMRAMEAEWAEIWGDPNDPKVKARIEAACAEMRARRARRD